MTAMMRWQVNRQFRENREVATIKGLNLDAVVQQLDLIFGAPPGLAWPYQEDPVIAQMMGEPEPIVIQPRHRLTSCHLRTTSPNHSSRSNSALGSSTSPSNHPSS